MLKKAHTEEQIVAVLRQAEAGEKVADICRKVGISEATYYVWKKQYAGRRGTTPQSSAGRGRSAANRGPSAESKSSLIFPIVSVTSDNPMPLRGSLRCGQHTEG